MPNASQALTDLLNPSLDVTDDKPKNTTSITLKNSNDELIRSIFKIKTKNKNTLFNTDEKIIELQKVIDKITDKEFQTECKKLKKSLQNLINHIKKIKKQKRIDSTVQHLDQLAYELCCDTLYYAEKRDYFNFINTTSRQIEQRASSIDKPRKFQGLRYILHVITEAFKYLFLIGFYLAYKRGGFSKTTTRGKINQFLQQRIKFYINNEYDPGVELHKNCYEVPDFQAPVIDILQKLRYKTILFNKSYFSDIRKKEQIISTFARIAQLRWTQVKELQLKYPRILPTKTLMRVIRKSEIQILTLDLNASSWDTIKIGILTTGLIGSQITTLNLKINMGSWLTDTIQAFVTGLQRTPATTLILQKNRLEHWNLEQCLTFAKGLKNTNISTLDLSGNNIRSWPAGQIQQFIEALADTPVRSINLGSIGGSTNMWSVGQLNELMIGLQKTAINNLEIEGRLLRHHFDIFLKLLPETKITNIKGPFLVDIIKHRPLNTICLKKIKMQANLSEILHHNRNIQHSTLRTIDLLFQYIQTSQTNSLTLHDTDFYQSLPGERRHLYYIDYNIEKIPYAVIVNKLHQSKINEINMIVYDYRCLNTVLSDWLTELKLLINTDEEKKTDQPKFQKEYTLNLSVSNLASVDDEDLKALTDGLKDDPANKLKCCIGTLDLSNTNLNKFSYTRLEALAIALATTNVHTVILNENDLTQNELKMFKWHLGKKQLSTFLLGNLENKAEVGKPKQPDSAIRTNFIKPEERAALNCINYFDQFSEVKTATELVPRLTTLCV